MKIEYPADPIVEDLLNRIKSRSDAGMKTYGQPMTRTDLPPNFWKTAAVEEIIDFLLYFLRLQRTRKEAEAFAEECRWVADRYEEPESVMSFDDVVSLLDFIYGKDK